MRHAGGRPRGTKASERNLPRRAGRDFRSIASLPGAPCASLARLSLAQRPRPAGGPPDRGQRAGGLGGADSREGPRGGSVPAALGVCAAPAPLRSGARDSGLGDLRGSWRSGGLRQFRESGESGVLGVRGSRRICDLGVSGAAVVAAGRNGPAADSTEARLREPRAATLPNRESAARERQVICQPHS